MLPTWPGASEIYSKLYAVLDSMANSEVIVYKNRRGNPTGCKASERMEDISKALDKGNEEQLKGLALQYGHLAR